MSVTKLYVDVGNGKKTPSIEFQTDNLPFEFTVKHIVGMVQMETDIKMRGKTLVGPDGGFHEHSLAWEKTGWKHGDTLRIVEAPTDAPSSRPGTSNNRSSSKTLDRPSSSLDRSSSSSKFKPLQLGGSLMLSGLEGPSLKPESGSLGAQRISPEGGSIEQILADLAAGKALTDSDASILMRGASEPSHGALSKANLMRGASEPSHGALSQAKVKDSGNTSEGPISAQVPSNKLRSDVALQAESSALQILREQQSEITSRSEACLLKLNRLKDLLHEGGLSESALVDHLIQSDLSIPRLPSGLKWNARDLMTYLQSVALLQTNLETWSREADHAAGTGLSGDVLRQQLPLCAQLIGVFSEFVIACIRDAAEGALQVLGRSAKIVWEEWRALPGARDLNQIRDIRNKDAAQTIPSWYNAPRDIELYLDMTNIESDPGQGTRSKLAKWLADVPFSVSKRIADFELYAQPDNFYWKKMTLRQRVAMIYLLDMAEEEDDAFHQSLEIAAGQIKGAQYKRGPVKRMERTAAKAVTDEKGDAFKIKDFHRALVVCPEPRHACEVFSAFEQAGSHIKIVKCKNGFVNDYWGYNLKLVMISIEVSGVLGEVQICPSEMFHIRDMMHHYYDFARAHSVDDFR